MPYRNGNYAAFYVAEPFSESNLGAFAAHDFVYYMMLRAWKGRDRSFPFIDSHGKTYNVRDGSSWEATLKPRLRERLRSSKNIILFLSSETKASRALTEEIEYGVGILGLPVIVVYPGIAPIRHDGGFNDEVYSLWDRLPAFKRLMDEVPTLHIPMEKNSIEKALRSTNYMVQSKCKAGCYRL
ncbi:MAG: TIR domain-containing protein [Eggerthellaceae bacterium]